MSIKNIFGLLLIVLITLIGFSAEAQKQQDITFENFQLQQNGARLYIIWTTAKNETTNYFEIEKSTDGEAFQTFAYVMGPDPASEGNQYAFYDKMNNLSGETYYRVKHINTDHQAQYSSVRKIDNKDI